MWAVETRMNGDILEKKCRKCDEFKPIHDYHKSASGRFGVTNKCKECCKVYYEENKEWVAVRQKEYAESNKEKISERNFRNHIKVRYNLTEEEYDELTKNGCEICGTFDDLAVDHDHITNKVRGILCRSCNRGIGTFKDNIYLLLRAAAYLESKQPSMPGVRIRG